MSDFADACLHTLKVWEPLSDNAPQADDGKILGFLNVGTGVDISIKELSEKISKNIDYKGEINWDTSKPDGTFKKQTLVGFMPNSEFEFVINGERLYRVMNKFITIKYEYQGNEEEYNPSWAQSS